MRLVKTPLVCIETLLWHYPELLKLDFLKIDTEGYEKILIPTLLESGFFTIVKPVVYLSLHPLHMDPREFIILV